MAHVLAIVRARVGQLLVRRQLEPEDDRTLADPLTDASPVLTGLVSTSVQGAPRPSPRAGARVSCLGDGPDLGHLTSRDPRQAHLDGFDLHANAWVPPLNRARLEQLCRYLLRPPLAQDRLPSRRARPRRTQGGVARWPSHFLFEPIEILENLAPPIPCPAVNLLPYYGVLASRDSR